MGLLDIFNSEEGRLGMGLLAAAGPRADGAGFGQRLQEGVGSVDAWKANQAKQKMADMQLQELQAKAAQEKQMRDLVARFGGGQGLAPIQGDALLPPQFQSGILPSAGKPGGFDFNGYANALSGIDPIKGLAMQQSLVKDNTPISVAPGTSLVDKRTFRPLFTAPKEDKEPDAIRQLKAIYGDGTPAYQAALQQYGAKMTTHQPSTVVNTGDNLGLKPKDRFDMEGKLRADYEKLTQSDNEIVGVAQDISGLFKQGGALKDQAAIYKFAKSLDPQGAVREADYAAIIRTAGGLDYVTGLVNKALTGEQLSPKQRIEMERVVNSMADVAKKRIGAVQKRTTNNAKMYNLEPANLFAPREDVGQNPPSDPLGIRKK